MIESRLLLERARVFILAGRPLLAIDDGERAFKLQPASMRARIELAEALLDAGQPENAAKLDVDRYLRRGEDKHVSDEALRELGTLDARLSANPKDADALVARARILRDLRQFTLALADANAALAINDKSAAAHFEAAQDLDGLDRQKEALLHARIATELDPHNSNMWFFRGVLERQRADFAGAVASQTRSIEINESLVALKRTRAMRTAHRKDSRSRRRSAPDPGTRATKIDEPNHFAKCGSRLAAILGALRPLHYVRSIRRCCSIQRRCHALFSSAALAIAMAGASSRRTKKKNHRMQNPMPAAIVIEPSSGKIAEGDTITITFPVSMVAADLIDVGDQPSPFVSEPKLDGTFLWKSQTEGVFTVSGVVAEARHRLTLAPGLKDATGKPFVVKDWSAEFKTPKFAITTEFSERKQLAARPQIYLESTYAVRLDEAAQHIYFQDREARERFPVEVIQTAEDKTADSLEATGFRVTPRAPLPVGHTFDLIVNGLLDAKSRRPLPYLQVMPAGKTEPLEVQWLGAFNHPLEEPTIRIKFDDTIDPVEVDAGADPCRACG